MTAGNDRRGDVGDPAAGSAGDLRPRAEELRGAREAPDVDRADRPAERASALLAQVCSLLTLGIAVLALTGWVSGLLVLARLSPAYIPMAPSTALGFGALGAGLFVHVRRSTQRPALHVTTAAAVVVIVLAALVLLRFAAILDLDVERLVLKSPPSFQGVALGRMSPVTAAGLLMGGLALLGLRLSGSRSGAGPDLPAVLAASQTAVSLVVLLGYLYGAPLLYGGTTIPVAMPTAAAMGLSGLGLLAATDPRAWPLRLVVGPSLRSRLMRAFLPATVGIIVVEGWLIATFAPASGRSLPLDVALIALVSVAALSGLIAFVARRTGDAIAVAQAKVQRLLRESEASRVALASLLSERQRAEDALRASEERHRRFFDLDLTGDYLSAPDGTLLACNRAFAKMMGYASVDEALGARTTSFYATPEDRQAFLDLLARERVLRNRESRLVRRDGKPIQAVENAVGIFDAAGRLQQLQGFLLDVTEQRQAEEALRQKEQLLSESQRIAHLGSWEVDLLTNRIVWSEELYRIAGVAPADVGHTMDAFLQLIHTEDRAAMQEWTRACAAGEKPAALEFRIVRPDGELRYIHGRGDVECDAENQPLRAVGTAQDITEGKRAEEEKEKLQARLVQAQKMEYVGRLAGGVAHDFNNALQTMLLNLEEALDEAGEGTALQEHLLEIRTAALHSADLTRQLLAFARQQSVRPQVLDLNDTVSGMVKMLQRLIGEDITLAWLPGHDLWSVRMDPSQLDQVLANLAVNARDAIAGVGHVTVETANIAVDDAFRSTHTHFVPGDYVRLTVSDDGRGMNAVTLAHIFEPFFTTKEVGAGTGLGLATVYGIVKQNEGFVHAYSEPGQGTTFEIFLPRFHAEATRASAAGRTQAVGGTETLLLVEDDPALLRAGRRTLEGLGYTVLTANRPSDARSAVEGHDGPIHLLITDVVMPEMNGRELCERLGSGLPGLKCLYMSGYPADVIAHRGVLDEGVRFIQKPFSADGLARKVREVLDQA